MKVAALAGGVGGAKLADGLARILPPQDLTIIVNIGDDFNHLGLRVCADLDTVCYNLAGIANPLTGWGLRDETWNVHDNLVRLGGPKWFHIGDRDLATHIERTRLLRSGMTLTQVTAVLCRAWNIACTVLPVSDDPVPTKIETDQGDILEFQDYFVRLQFQPAVKAVHFPGVENVLPAPGVLDAIRSADLVVICPSNPIISIDPILAVPGVREAVMSKPVVALSPIVGGKAIKGPLAKMILELYGVQPSAEWVAEYYQRTLRLDGFLLDRQDYHLVPAIEARGIICKTIPSIMLIDQDRVDVAGQVLEFIQQTIGRQQLL